MNAGKPHRGDVLVVDDDDECCSALLMLLAVEGFEVRAAKSGAEALALIEERRPDVLLSDIRMPGMDGFALLGQVQKTSRVPVVMMSAEGDNEANALRAGALSYIHKPIDFDIVVRALDAALEVGTILV